MAIKINDVPKEYRTRIDFACMVCRESRRENTGKTDDCAWRSISKSYCDAVSKILENEKENNDGKF